MIVIKDSSETDYSPAQLSDTEEEMSTNEPELASSPKSSDITSNIRKKYEITVDLSNDFSFGIPMPNVPPADQNSVSESENVAFDLHEEESVVSESVVEIPPPRKETIKEKRSPNNTKTRESSKQKETTSSPRSSPAVRSTFS